jgi:hypothetical protein
MPTQGQKSFTRIVSIEHENPEGDERQRPEPSFDPQFRSDFCKPAVERAASVSFSAQLIQNPMVTGLVARTPETITLAGLTSSAWLPTTAGSRWVSCLFSKWPLLRLDAPKPNKRDAEHAHRVSSN